MNKAEDRSIAVVGAGIVGASIAFHLAERGARVTLLDAGTPGEGATRTSFAWINARDKNPRVYHDLNRRALDVWPRFLRRLGCESAATWGGEIRWTQSADSARQMGDRVATLRSWGYPVRELCADELEAAEPLVRTAGARGGSYTTVDGHVDTSAVMRACLAAVERYGVDVVPNAAVTGFLTEQQETHTLLTERGEYRVDAAVIACGADSAGVAALAGVDVPMYDTFGATIITTPVAPLMSTAAVIHTPRESDIPLNVRQFADGRVMLHGGTHGQSHDESLGRTEEDAARVFQAAKHYLPALEEARIEEVRRARRPIPEDGHSVVGFTDPVRNLYLAVTHSGVTLAPLLGEWAAIELLDGVTVDLLAPYRPGRFQALQTSN